MIKIHERLKKDFIKKVEKDKDVLAVILFGGIVKRKTYSDVDVCIVLKTESYNNLFLSKKKLEYVAFLDEKFDVQIFQQLPLYIRIRILKEGKVMFCKDESLLYEFAYETIKDSEDYQKIYTNYLEGISYA
ncbi:MAG: nucleotidyltransferase domain-containing protein [Thermoplasmatales archaeon]|nr:nucleotidyltransferase domain-containing protein [Thermoplasmatales archaeon]